MCTDRCAGVSCTRTRHQSFITISLLRSTEGGRRLISTLLTNLFDGYHSFLCASDPISFSLGGSKPPVLLLLWRSSARYSRRFTCTVHHDCKAYLGLVLPIIDGSRRILPSGCCIPHSSGGLLTARLRSQPYRRSWHGTTCQPRDDSCVVQV